MKLEIANFPVERITLATRPDTQTANSSLDPQ